LGKILRQIKGSVYVPTLSELINGCGNYDFGFWRGGSTKWEAWIRKAEHRGDVKEEICAIGTTPEEAVAGLWLKINNKKLYETKF